MTSHDAYLSMENLHFRWPSSGQSVLRGLTGRLNSGKLTCLLGANGAGKTTLFKLIMGLLPLQQGALEISGTSLTHLTPRQRAQLLAWVPQHHPINFSYRVHAMILMGTTASFGFWAMPDRKAHHTAQRAMELLGIEELAHQFYHELSGGEQQLVLIARALAQNTPILIMDEPCANLDYGNQMSVMDKIRSLAHQGYLVLLSTHHPDHALLFADDVMILQDGQSLAHGAPDKVMTSQVLSQIYHMPLKLSRLCEEDQQQGQSPLVLRPYW